MKSFALVLGLLLLSAAACSESDSEPKPESHAGVDPLYLSMTRVWDDTSTTSYLHVVKSLKRGTDLDASQALIDLTAEAGPEHALTVPGFLQNVARIR